MKSVHDFPELNPKNAQGISPSGVPYKIMVVEDKEFQRKQIVQILESEKYNIVAQASNGEDALIMYENLKNRLDLITTDLDMPKLDGYAFLYQIKQKNPDQKVAFISEDTSKGVVQDLIGMGASDFILKPINRITILSRIKKILSK
jgi:two-component system, chemotaxis family, chemotaxis protein CheY